MHHYDLKFKLLHDDKKKLWYNISQFREGRPIQFTPLNSSWLIERVLLQITRSLVMPRRLENEVYIKSCGRWPGPFRWVGTIWLGPFSSPHYPPFLSLFNANKLKFGASQFNLFLSSAEKRHHRRNTRIRNPATPRFGLFQMCFWSKGETKKEENELKNACTRIHAYHLHAFLCRRRQKNNRTKIKGKLYCFKNATGHMENRFLVVTYYL